ncbi:MAG: aldo/keto reductase [Piscinibacter sp.]|nr:aldo/keto reductase [Piscinibacter sp.]
MQHVSFPDGTTRPALGLGTWRMGESARARAAEVAAVRLALELGYRVIDSAEMYGEGGAEEVVGRALAEALRAGTVRREDVFVVSKVYPHNASRRGIPAACERSLRRLGLERIDLYLLHWRGAHPLVETVEAFEALRAAGRIGAWGVSNFDTDDMLELAEVPGGAACAANQVYFSLGERGAGFELLPWLNARGIPLMAYCPIDQGRLAGETRLAPLAARLGVSPAQLALAWVLHQPGVMAIPKAVREAHLRENFAAAALRLDEAALREIDTLFPPPARRAPLAMT